MRATSFGVHLSGNDGQGGFRSTVRVKMDNGIEYTADGVQGTQELATDDAVLALINVLLETLAPSGDEVELKETTDADELAESEEG